MFYIKVRAKYVVFLEKQQTFLHPPFGNESVSTIHRQFQDWNACAPLSEFKDRKKHYFPQITAAISSQHKVASITSLL